jgi:hypothetical protein
MSELYIVLTAGKEKKGVKKPEPIHECKYPRTSSKYGNGGASWKGDVRFAALRSISDIVSEYS